MAMVSRLAVAVLVSVGLSSAARAQEADCSDPQNQMEINICAEQDWQDQDARLNDEYQSAIDRAKEFDAGGYSEDSAVAALKTAQRAWLPFRDGNCAAEAFAMKGGSGEAMIYYGCMAAMTATRADELAAWMSY